MRYTSLILSFGFLTLLPLRASEPNRSIPVHDPDGRGLCVTITQSQRVRFDRCATNEVMTGIRSLDPITVYCTTVLANCPNRDSGTDSEVGKKQ